MMSTRMSDKGKGARFAVCMLALVLAAGPFSLVWAQTTSTVNATIPFNSVTVQNPCISGETVTLNGSIHAVLQVTRSAQGAITDVRGHLNAQGVSGTGAPSGKKYRGSGTAKVSTTVAAAPGTYTVTGRVRLIGQGPDNHFFGTATARITIGASNNITNITLVSVTTDCR